MEIIQNKFLQQEIRNQKIIIKGSSKDLILLETTLSSLQTTNGRTAVEIGGKSNSWAASTIRTARASSSIAVVPVGVAMSMIAIEATPMVSAIPMAATVSSSMALKAVLAMDCLTTEDNERRTTISSRGAGGFVVGSADDGDDDGSDVVLNSISVGSINEGSSGGDEAEETVTI